MAIKKKWPIIFFGFATFALVMAPRIDAHAWYRYKSCISPLACRSVNSTKPRTKHGVWRAYQWFVNVNDGVTKREALIMAQYEVVQKGLDQNYHLAKPKVLSETQSQWVVRLPGKFSLTKGKADMYVVCINKENGNLTCSRIEEENEP